MNKLLQLKQFIDPIISFEKLLKQAKSKGMIIGGVAASLLGKPRLTADIDAVVILTDENIQEFLRIAEKNGFIPRIKNAIDFAEKNRVLLLRHKKSGMDLDISLGLLLFEKEAVERSNLVKMRDVTFHIPIPEDLIIFKAIAHRDQDILDIREIVNSNPDIDVKYIKKTVIDFARLLEMPEIWNDIKHFFRNIK